jgi:hypothetical protein
MDTLSNREFQELLEFGSPQCVSLYMPTHRTGREERQDPVRLKNLLGEAKEQLLERGADSRQLEPMLRPAESLLADTNFWQNQDDGLALFIGPSFFRRYRLPREFVPQAVVGTRFYLKPLIPLSGIMPFFLVAVSQHAVRLFRCTRYDFEEVHLEDVPRDLSEALMLDVTGTQLNRRVGQNRGGDWALNRNTAAGGHPGSFHGQTPWDDKKKEYITQFMHRIDERLHAYLDGSNSPLVFAGVDYLFPLYRQANSYPYLLDSSVEGNPEGLGTGEMHRQARELVLPHFLRAQQDTLERYRELAGSRTQRTAEDIRTIVPAAFHGQVAQLLVDENAQVWGRYDQEHESVAVDPQRERDDEELVDLAAAQTLRNGGTVYALDTAGMPAGTAAAAILRY